MKERERNKLDPEDPKVKIDVRTYLDHQITALRPALQAEYIDRFRLEFNWYAKLTAIGLGAITLILGIGAPQYIENRVLRIFEETQIRPRIDDAVSTRLQPLVTILGLREKALRSRKSFSQLQQLANAPGDYQDIAKQTLTGVSDQLHGFEVWTTFPAVIWLDGKKVEWDKLSHDQRFRLLLEPKNQRIHALTGIASALCAQVDQGRVVQSSIEILKTSDSMLASTAVSELLLSKFHKRHPTIQVFEFDKWIEKSKQGKLGVRKYTEETFENCEEPN